MNGVTVLFVLSCIFVPMMLILINYESIDDFYAYSIPFNDLKVEHIQHTSDPDIFQKIKRQENSTCFVTPSMNEYCYEKPRGGTDFKFSHPVGSNGINGEMHFEPVSGADGYWTMRNIAPMSDSSALITFSDNGDRYPPETLAGWHITGEFEFTRIVEKYDTFVAYCADNGKSFQIMQYLGTLTVEETDCVATWHVGATSEQGIKCKYPQIIQRSFDHDFGI